MIIKSKIVSFGKYIKMKLEDKEKMISFLILLFIIAVSLCFCAQEVSFKEKRFVGNNFFIFNRRCA